MRAVLTAFLLIVLLGSAGDASEIELRAETPRVGVTDRIEFLRDSDGTLGIETLLALGDEAGFEAGFHGREEAAGRQNRYWFKLRVAAEDGAERWFLALPYRWVNHATLYTVAGGRIVNVAQAGALAPADPSRPTERFSVFEVEPPATGKADLYLAVDGITFPTLSIELMTLSALHHLNSDLNLFFGTIFGLMIAAVLYLFMIWRVSPSSTVPYLLSYIVSAGVYSGFVSGFVREHGIWTDGASASVIGDVAMTGIWFFGIGFARVFLNSERHFPRYDVALKAVMWGALPVAGAVVSAPNVVGPILTYFGIIVLGVIIGLTALSVLTKIPGANPFLTGWAAIFVGSVIRVGADLGWVPFGAVTVNIYYATLALSSLSLAVGLMERLRVRQRIRQQRHHAIVDCAHDAIMSFDRDCRIIDFNPAAEQMFGLTADELEKGWDAEDLLPEQARLRLQEVVCGDRQVCIPRTEMVARRASGDAFPVEITITSTGDRDYVLYTAHLRDLTETKRLDAELRAQRDRLFQAEKLSALGSLLAGVAHELNNPLSVIVGRTAMLKDSAPDPHTRQVAEKIYTAAQRCARIVKSFLAMARKRPLARRDADFNEIVAGATDLMAHGLRSDNITVDVDLSELMPAQADPDQLTQVFVNLIANARQVLAGHAGPRRLVISTRQSCGGDCAEITIQDNGPGVPAELRERVFEPFFTTKKVGEGTGLGLSICRSIVQAHGGVIGVAESSIGGAKFVINLPNSAKTRLTNERLNGAERIAAG